MIKEIINKKVTKNGKLINYLKDTVAVSLSVQIVIAPIIIYFYKTISFTFIISNILSRIFNKYNNNFWLYNFSNILCISRYIYISREII